MVQLSATMEQTHETQLDFRRVIARYDVVSSCYETGPWTIFLVWLRKITRIFAVIVSPRSVTRSDDMSNFMIDQYNLNKSTHIYKSPWKKRSYSQIHICGVDIQWITNRRIHESISNKRLANCCVRNECYTSRNPAWWIEQYSRTAILPYLGIEETAPA